MTRTPIDMDAWIASLSSGETVVERWVKDELSPWQRLMQLCKDKNLWVTNLRLTICSETKSLTPHAPGYWQLYQQSLLQGVPEDKIPVVRGIGCVVGDVVKIIWGVRTQTNEAYFWDDSRHTEGQNNIIWTPKRNSVIVN